MKSQIVEKRLECWKGNEGEVDGKDDIGEVRSDQGKCLFQSEGGVVFFFS